VTEPAFEHLLKQVQLAHDEHPDLGEFCAFPDDLTPSEYSRFHVPAADLMRRDTGLFSNDLAGLRDAFVAAGPMAQWRETYKATNIGQDFLNRFGCYALIGAGGPWISARMSGFVVYMPASLHYPWHHHPAEEMYLVLGGVAEFLREGEAPETLAAGDTSFHASNQPHSMTTHEHPVIAYVVWRNHLRTTPVLTEREVAQ